MAEKKIPPTPVTVTVPTTAKLNFAVSLGSVELGAGGTPPPSDTTPPAAAAPGPDQGPVVQAAPPKSTETEERADPWRNIFLVFLGLALGLAAGYMLATMGKPSVAQTSTAPAVAICPPVDTGMAERLNTATLELGTLRANNLTLNTTNATLTERLKSCESPVAKKDVTIAERKPDVRNPNPRKSDQPSSRKDEGKNEPVPSTGYWYWRENTATAEKPGKCIFSGGTGIGKPPFCASFTIVVPKDKESKTEWIGRVGNGRVALDQTIWQKKD